MVNEEKKWLIVFLSPTNNVASNVFINFVPLLARFYDGEVQISSLGHDYFRVRSKEFMFDIMFVLNVILLLLGIENFLLVVQYVAMLLLTDFIYFLFSFRNCFLCLNESCQVEVNFSSKNDEKRRQLCATRLCSFGTIRC